MAEFTYDIRDLKFILNECLDMEELFGLKRFKDNYDLSDVDIILNEAYKVAQNIVFPINKEGDKIGGMRLVNCIPHTMKISQKWLT